MRKDEIPSGYTRVTEILSTYAKLDHIDPDVLKNAAERGTLVHEFCELYSLNLLIQEPPNHVIGYFNSFKHWFDTYVEDVFMSEKRLNHEKYKLTGKFDMVVCLKKHENRESLVPSETSILIDLKTPQTPSKTWQLQTAAYQMMLREVEGIIVPRRACLVLDKDGGQARFYEHTSDKDIEFFLQALTLHRFFI